MTLTHPRHEQHEGFPLRPFALPDASLSLVSWLVEPPEEGGLPFRLRNVSRVDIVVAMRNENHRKGSERRRGACCLRPTSQPTTSWVVSFGDTSVVSRWFPVHVSVGTPKEIHISASRGCATAVEALPAEPHANPPFRSSCWTGCCQARQAGRKCHHEQGVRARVGPHGAL